jgi:hypothetical protein
MPSSGRSPVVSKSLIDAKELKYDIKVLATQAKTRIDDLAEWIAITFGDWDPHKG